MLQPHLSFSPEEELQALELHPAEADASEPPSQQGLERWKASFMNYHRAAGHPSNYNLARIIKDAGKSTWHVQAAHELRCDDCAALKLGGSSCGKVPPASVLGWTALNGLHTNRIRNI